MATRASLLGVFAAHALLLAFTLKMRMSAALKQQDAKLVSGTYLCCLTASVHVHMLHKVCTCSPASKWRDSH